MASTGFRRVFSVCQAVRLPKVFVTFALVLPSSEAWLLPRGVCVRVGWLDFGSLSAHRHEQQN